MLRFSLPRKLSIINTNLQDRVFQGDAAWTAAAEVLS
jgi:hypothetical protein